ncbi:putative palmitoyltransferase ZDHHC12 [Tritrichomonas foetus]|uniref:Palmitoyltransferase n=1 Tax=Tritrichomonas foetus TaxID=1144522 RepID=A0A1J4KK45_9EUKA|nr:putative palmitoyltransferase ZDHHC12 [Tritrichomonas foetus]|eukprot:OHT11498.1 putative palmitoyltransferase ZDHHC12 [Tritrichomonas foetus]
MSHEDLPPDQVKGSLINLAPFMVLIHLVSVLVIPFTETRFTTSFYRDFPLFYYFVYVYWGVMVKCYSSCCSNPGFVTNEQAIPPEEITKDSCHFFCQECQMYIPYRASHCRSCKRCILRRDHHCPWTGICIGRDNHLAFLIWTFVESILMFIVSIDLISSVFVYCSPLEWISRFKANIFMLPFTLFSFTMVTLLFITHFLMMMNNTTTWESKRRETITYLRDIPLGINPFDKGTKENIKEFLFMKYYQTTWKTVQINLSLADFENEQKILSRYLMEKFIKLAT